MRSRGSDSHRLSVPLKSDALTIEPPKLQTSIAQTQQYKPILTAFSSFLLFTLSWQCFLLSHSNSRFHCHNTVAILDSLVADPFSKWNFCNLKNQLFDNFTTYRICSSTAPLLNITSPLFKSPVFGFFLNRTPFFCQKVPFLRDFLNWTSPKNSYWKIQPRGYTRADTVTILISFCLT